MLRLVISAQGAASRRSLASCHHRLLGTPSLRLQDRTNTSFRLAAIRLLTTSTNKSTDKSDSSSSGPATAASEVKEEEVEIYYGPHGDVIRTLKR